MLANQSLWRCFLPHSPLGQDELMPMWKNRKFNRSSQINLAIFIGSAQFFERRSAVTLDFEGKAEAVVSLCEVRLEANGSAVFGDGPIQVAFLAERDAKVEVSRC